MKKLALLIITMAFIVSCKTTNNMSTNDKESQKKRARHL